MSTLPILPERELLCLQGWNRTAAPFPVDRTLIDLFLQQVARTPDAEALVHTGERLTYRQLRERAGRIACELKSCGVKPETLVGICLERSPTWWPAISARSLPAALTSPWTLLTRVIGSRSCSAMPVSACTPHAEKIPRRFSRRRHSRALRR